MKAKKKPITVEFFYVTELLLKGIQYPDVIKKAFDSGILVNDQSKILVNTLEGCMEATTDDVIIVGVHGELYPCKKDIFYETYDIQLPTE